MNYICNWQNVHDIVYRFGSNYSIRLYKCTYPANENGLKKTEMDSFCSCQIQILIIRIHFYPIKFPNFLKSILIHMKG